MALITNAPSSRISTPSPFPSKSQIFSKLAKPLPLKEQIALVTTLRNSHEFDNNFDSNDVFCNELTELTNQAIANHDEPFAAYLILEQGVDLKRCEATYQLAPDWQTEALLDKLAEATHLQFPLIIEQTSQEPGEETSKKITLNLSLPEARKLAQNSEFFQTQWTNGNEYNDDINENDENRFTLPLPPSIDTDVFQSVIFAAAGQKVTPVLAEKLPSVFASVNYLVIRHSHAVIPALVTNNNLKAYRDIHSLAAAENDQHHLRAYQDVYAHMAVHAPPEARPAIVDTLVAMFRNNPTEQNLFIDILQKYINIDNKNIIFDAAQQTFANAITFVILILESAELALNNPEHQLIRPSAAEAFNNVATHNKLIDIGHHTGSDQAIEALANAISWIVNEHPFAKVLFTTDAMCNMLVKLGNQANSDQAREAIIHVLVGLMFGIKPPHSTLATPAMRDMLLKMIKKAIPKLAPMIAYTINKITAGNPEERRLYINAIQQQISDHTQSSTEQQALDNALIVMKHIHH